MTTSTVIYTLKLFVIRILVVSGIELVKKVQLITTTKVIFLNQKKKY